MSETPSSARQGLFYGLAAYGIWGVIPLYFNALLRLSGGQISAEEVLALRIVWAIPFLLLLLTLSRSWSLLPVCFRVPSLRWTLLATTVLIAVNWYVYIYGVTSGQVLQTSLGYFINPLVSVLMGMVFFRERLRRFQWLAIALAAIGVSGITIAHGELPWIALSLTACFSVYGLLRKKAPVDGLVGLTVETFMIAPFAGAYLLWLAMDQEMALGAYGPECDVLIVLSGVATALPLMCFGQAARRLRLSTLGFMQYISPTLQFLCGAVILGEALRPWELECFVVIWLGLAVYSADSLLALRNRPSYP